MKKKIIIFLAIILLVILGNSVFGRFFDKGNSDIPAAVPIVAHEAEIIELKDRMEKISILPGETFGNLLATSGVEYALAMEIYEAAKETYDLVKIREGRIIELTFDKTDNGLKELRYKVDTEDELHVRNVKYFSATSTISASSSPASADGEWQARLEPIPYEVRRRTAEGTIETSMYQAAIDNDIDIAAIIELANAFQWTIDFAMDPRVGDKFRFIYEERYLNGAYVMPGQIFAGIYVNDGKEYYAYYFEEDSDNKGFYDQDGNSAQRMFLKAPVEFRYISSGFTTGLRYVEAFNVSTGHRAIDYAASAGTPIRSVGNGTVTFAGWSSAGYGNLVSIRHNGTYGTNYGHQSKIAVKRGQKVTQGQVIGYVGSTGFSTGPHLHYEMVKNGVKVNPLLEIQPPGKPIRAENRERFNAEILKWKQDLVVQK